MSEEWRLFNRYYDDDSIGSIMVNESIAGTLQELPGKIAICAITLETPSEYGLLTPDEVERYQSFDEALLLALEEAGGRYVGRMVLGGQAIAYTYGDFTRETLDEIGVRLETDYGYECAWAIEEDPDYSRYWTDLYPVPAEYRRFADESLIETLEKSGDKLESPRRIDHFVIFPDEDGARAFLEWAATEGFDADEEGPIEETEEGFKAQVWHTACPTIGDVGHATVKLDAQATETGGRYDGWETFIIR